MKDILKITLLAIMPFISSVTLADYKAGEAKSQVCSSCHGINGISEIAMYPKLAGQYKDYLSTALHAYKSGSRKNAIMSGFATGLSNQDIEDLSDYYSQQDGLKVLPVK